MHFEGKPCRKCGSTLRYVSKRTCVACSRAYDKARSATMTEEERAKRRAYNASYRDDPERKAKAVERTKAWMEANPERSAEWRKRYREENRQKIYAWIRDRRAKKASAPGRHTAADIEAIGSRQKWKCAWCGCKCEGSYHVDHIIPLAKGGTNWPDNLCISCPTCNLKKKAKLPHEFAQKMGKLL